MKRVVSDNLGEVAKERKLNETRGNNTTRLARRREGKNSPKAAGKRGR